MSVKALTWAMDQLVGSPTRKLILLTLADAANHAGECFPSQARLARVAEVTERSVRSHLKQLEDVGLVARQPRFHPGGGRTSDWYVLGIPENISGGKAEDISGTPGSGLPVSHMKEPSNERPPDLAAFEDVWKIHPVGSKKRAREQYAKAVPAKIDAERMATALRWYRAQYRVGQKDGNGGVFRGQHLERWIRDERWAEAEAFRDTRTTKHGTVGQVGRFYE